MKPVLIVKTGSVPDSLQAQGDYPHLIARAVDPCDIRTVDVVAGEPLPKPVDVAAAIVTGSSAMVSERLAWSERTATWLRQAVEAQTPVLGICFGHQLLAQACGGKVGLNPQGREIGSIAVDVNPEGQKNTIFSGIHERFYTQASHSETVLELPPDARVLASNGKDRCQAFALGSWAWGVQFHPELDASTIPHYIRKRMEVLRAEGLDPDALLRAVRDDPAGAQLLRNFLQTVQAKMRTE